jgi:1-acyl-sn-glycerol-3-phosphate acyltransferase
MKCLPVTRGGERTAVADVLNRFVYLLSQGEVGMIFPEGGRSRSGRVEVDMAAPGVGRVVTTLPGCRVLCVYLRGERQRPSGTARSAASSRADGADAASPALGLARLARPSPTVVANSLK